VLLAVFAGFAQGGASDLRAIYRSVPLRGHSGILAQATVPLHDVHIVWLDPVAIAIGSKVELDRQISGTLVSPNINVECEHLGTLSQRKAPDAPVLDSIATTSTRCLSCSP